MCIVLSASVFAVYFYQLSFQHVYVYMYINTCVRMFLMLQKNFHVCTCNGGASSIHYACTMYMCLCIIHLDACYYLCCLFVGMGVGVCRYGVCRYGVR